MDARRPFLKRVEDVLFAIPWALLLLAAVAIYATVAHIRGDLDEAEFVDAFVGGGLLAIAHGVHHHARKLPDRA